jgi:hypothetical protein
MWPDEQREDMQAPAGLSAEAFCRRERERARRPLIRQAAQGREDLHYRAELSNEATQAAEQVLAFGAGANTSIAVWYPPLHHSPA